MLYNSPALGPSRCPSVGHCFDVTKPYNTRIIILSEQLPARWLNQVSNNTRSTISKQIRYAVRADAIDVGVLPPSEITVLIKECRNYTSLSAVLYDHGPYFNYIHAAAAFTHAAQLAQQLIIQDQHLGSNHQQQQQDVEGSTYSSEELTIQRQQEQRQQESRALLHVLPDVVQTLKKHCSSLQGRQTANCMWAVCKLLHVLIHQQQQEEEEEDSTVQELVQQLLILHQQLVQQTEHCWHLFNGQELVLLLYAAATMPVVVTPTSLSAAANIAGNSVNPQQQAMQPAVASSPISNSSRSTDTDAIPPDVDADDMHESTAAAQAAGSSAAAGCLTLGVSISWVNTAVNQLQKQHRSKKLRLKPQEFQMLLNSLRLLQQQQQQQESSCIAGISDTLQQQQQQQVQIPVSLLQALLSAAADHSRRCSSRDIAGILYSSAALNLKCSSSSIDKLLAPLSNSRKLQQCNPVDVTNILYALATVGFKPQKQQQQQQQGAGTAVAAVTGLVQQLVQQQQQFTASELAVCLYSLGRMRLRPPGAAVAAVAAAAVQGLQPQQQRELALVAWSLGALRTKVQPPLLQAVLDKYLQGSPAATAAAAVEASLLPDVSSSSVAPPSKKAPAAAASQTQQQQLLRRTAQHTSMLLWGMGRLGYCPPLTLLLPLLRLAEQVLCYASSEHLACICYALARLGLRPSRNWLLHFYQHTVKVCQQQQQWQQQQQDAAAAAAAVMSSGDLDRDGVQASSSTSTRLSSRQVSEGFVGFSAQQVSMIIWGLAQLQAQVLDSTAAAAAGERATEHSDTQGDSKATEAVSSVTGLLQSVLSSSESVLQCSPPSVGVILWGCEKLGYKPEPQIIRAALQAFLSHKQHSKQRKDGRPERQQQQRLPVQQQQRYAQSLALCVWSLAKLGASDEQKQQLMQVLWANIQQLEYFRPVELTAIIWGLNKLQLTPPTPWLLNFYIRAQLQFDLFTDVRLASLTVPLYMLLKQSQQQDAVSDGRREQPPLQVPPAVWQLQLELQLQERRARRRKRRSRSAQQQAVVDDLGYRDKEEGVFDDTEREQLRGQRDKHRYDPLRIVSSVVRRWRSVSVGSSAAAAAKQLAVQKETVLV